MIEDLEWRVNPLTGQKELWACDGWVWFPVPTCDERVNKSIDAQYLVNKPDIGFKKFGGEEGSENASKR